MKNNLQMFIIVGALLLLLAGCVFLIGPVDSLSPDGSVSETEAPETPAAEGVEKVTQSVEDYHLRDNQSVYEDDDEDSVVTMYLTVR